MSKDAFWALIQEAKTACGQDLNAMEDYLREQLVSMGPAAAKNFHDILQTYEDLADQYLPRFLPRLCEKYGGPERFLAAPSTWNYDLHEIRRLLDEGKVQDMATKKEKGGGAR